MKNKKLISLFLFLFITCLSFSQIIERRTYSLKIGSEYPVKQDIPILFDLDKSQIKIFSASPQYFDIETTTSIRIVDSYKVYKFYVNDTNYVHAYLELWLSDLKADVIRITYSNLTYEYALYE